jgi:uncharacterized protein YdiU (UPF0061 family)
MMNQLGRDRIKEEKTTQKSYQAFSRINGDHPLKEKAPDSYIEYPVRTKHGGKVAYFNYELAVEMGLIPKNHPHVLTPELEKEILHTFSLVIINEYDEMHGLKFPKNEIRPNKYMATRYLQIQHPDKAGRTSGDGRSMWNGCVTNNGVTWDVTSCGTGATKLSPACNINKKFYQTGDPSISYGCGLSEVNEGLETLFFSEIFNRNNIRTERILTIIEYEKGLAINVRANPNLIRPSHFFGLLKQGNLKGLKNIADYYIEREIKNKKWSKDHTNQYEQLGHFVAKNFAETAAMFEDEYIFCWMDWDGDNILMDGGIIDYGSIRQFGLFHSEYRYDDVERFSTSILEQKLKARYIVQSFAQIVDFIQHKKKRSIQFFRNHPTVKKFDQHFLEAKDRNLLHKIGFEKNVIDLLMQKERKTVQAFRNEFAYFERAKAKRGIYKVADGITRDAIFCMRDLLRELPQLYLMNEVMLSTADFLEIAKSSYAKPLDMKFYLSKNRETEKFQKLYLSLLNKASNLIGKNHQQLLLSIAMRSSIINKYDRVTGDSITHVVNKVSGSRPKISGNELDSLIQEFCQYQNLNPDRKSEKRVEVSRPKLLKGIYTIVRECREGI